MNSINPIHRYISVFIHSVITYFFIALVIVPKAYSVGVILSVIGLLLFIFYFSKDRKKLFYDKRYSAFLITFSLYFIFYLFSVFIHQDTLKILDNPSKSIIFLFIFFLLQYYSINLKLFLYVIPLGGIATGIYAFYQKFILHYERALSDTTYVIQSGDMAMSLGVFSLALMFYCLRKQYHYLTCFCAIGTLGGMLGSFLSATRGGWLLMPFVLVILFYLNRQYLSKKLIVSFISALLCILTVLLLTPSSKMLSQLEKAYTEVNNFGQKDNADTSVGARLELWQASVDLIIEKPLFGWGTQGAKDQRKLQGDKGILAAFPANLGHAHNQYINDTLERGILGLFALLAIFLAPLWLFFKAYRKHKDNLEIRLLATLGIIHITSVMSYGLTQAFFSHNSGNMFYFFLTVLFYAMILDRLKVKKP